MSHSSHLSFFSRLPVTQQATYEVLAQPFVPPSQTLRTMLDKFVLPSSVIKPNSVTYYPDEQWLEAHLAFFSELSGWEVLALITRTQENEREDEGYSPVSWVAEATPASGPAGYMRDSYNISHIAFVYADAALAEQLAARLTPGETGLMEISTGSDDTLNLLLTASSTRAIPYHWSNDKHPLHSWLLAARSDKKPPLSDWPEWQAIAARMRDGTHPALARWRPFVAAQRKALIDRASATQPVRLNESHYTDGKTVFHGEIGDDDAGPLNGCDPYTFQGHPDGEQVGHYATDANGLWSWGHRLPCKNPQSFGPLPNYQFLFTDGHYIYRESEALPDVVASEIAPVPGAEDWLREGFLWGGSFYTLSGMWGWNSINVDTASFRALGYRHYADTKRVYRLEDGELHTIDDFDPATARIIEHGDTEYLCDAQRVATVRNRVIQPKPLKAANAAEFHGVPRLPFVTDGVRIWLGSKVCTELRGKPLSAPRLHPDMPEVEDDYSIWRGDVSYFRNGDSVGYVLDGEYRWLEEADAATFECIDDIMAHDARHVWWAGEIVKGANGAGFAWVSQFGLLWTDGKRLYRLDEKVDLSLAHSHPVREEFVLSFAQVGDGYWLHDKPIDGWHINTHRPSAIGCIEDADHYYTESSDESLLVWNKEWSAMPIKRYEFKPNAKAWRLK